MGERVVRRERESTVLEGACFMGSDQYCETSKVEIDNMMVWGNYSYYYCAFLTSGKVGPMVQQDITGEEWIELPFPEPAFEGSRGIDYDYTNIGYLGSSDTKHWLIQVGQIYAFESQHTAAQDVYNAEGNDEHYIDIVIFSVDRNTGQFGDVPASTERIYIEDRTGPPYYIWRGIRFHPWVLARDGRVAIFAGQEETYYGGQLPWKHHLLMFTFDFDVETGQRGGITTTDETMQTFSFGEGDGDTYDDENYPIITEQPVLMPDGKIAVPVTSGVFSFRDKSTDPPYDARAGCHVVIADPDSNTMETTHVYETDPSYWGPMTLVPTSDGLLVNVALTGYWDAEPYDTLPVGSEFDNTGREGRLYHFGYSDGQLTLREYLPYLHHNFYYPGNDPFRAEWFFGGISGGPMYETSLFGDGGDSGQMVTIMPVDYKRSRWEIRRWSVESGVVTLTEPRPVDLYPSIVSDPNAGDYGPYRKSLSSQFSDRAGYSYYAYDLDDVWVGYRCAGNRETFFSPAPTS